MESRTLHISQITAKGACSEQVELFRSLFGESVEVTEEWALAHCAKFDWYWGAKNLLSPQAGAEYDRATDLASVEYDRVMDLAWAEYNRVRGPAWAEYVRVTDPARAEYVRVTGPARAEYNRVTGLARAEYVRVRSLAWARCYISDQAETE